MILARGTKSGRYKGRVPTYEGRLSIYILTYRHQNVTYLH